MVAIDTVVGTKANPGATISTVTMNTGDPNVIRSFQPPARARIERIIRAGTSSGSVRLTSPLLHDPTRGITFTSAESPTVFPMPQEIGQNVISQDTLTIAVSGGTAETDLVALAIYYESLQGANGRYYMPSDVLPLIDQIKPVVVAVTNSATIGAWTDTVITTTENLMRADNDYAVLGYVVDTAQAVVTVKGIDTGNLRVGGPGTTATDDTADYFIQWSMREGTPHIPVINASNNGAIFVSTADTVASSTSNVQLILGHLTRSLPNPSSG